MRTLKTLEPPASAVLRIAEVFVASGGVYVQPASRTRRMYLRKRDLLFFVTLPYHTSLGSALNDRSLIAQGGVSTISFVEPGLGLGPAWGPGNPTAIIHGYTALKSAS